MARRRPSRRVQMDRSGQQQQVSPGLARAMRGLRNFAAQAQSAYGKLGETLKGLIPVVNAFGSAWARMRAALAETTKNAYACASGFNRIKWAMGGCIPVAAVLTKQMVTLGTASRAAATFGQGAFASMAAGAGKAALSSAGLTASFAALLGPLAAIAAVAGTAYVALFKWDEVPLILKTIIVVASPLVLVLRSLVAAWNLATLPIRVFKSGLDAVTGSVKLAVSGLKSLAVGAVTLTAKAAASLVTLGPRFARSFAVSLDSTLGKLTGWARSAAGVIGRVGASLGEAGSYLAGLAGPIVDPLRRGAEEFARTGAAALALATAAGLTVDQLTALGYAAERSGASVEQFASAVETVNGKLDEAKAGSKEAATAFEQLELSVQDLAGMDAEQRFIAIGSAIAGLADPAERAKAAQDAFGTSSRELIDVFAKGGAGLANMRREAERLGLVMSGPQAAAAKAMADAYKLVQNATLGLWRTLGAAVAPQLTATAKATADVIQAVTAWVSKNGALIAQAFKIASAVAGVATAMTTVGSVLAVLTPGLVTVGALLAAGYLAWGRFGKAATDALAPVRKALETIRTETMAVMGGVWDAIQGGDLELAVEIAWLGVQKAWVAGLRALASITGETMGGIFNALAAGDWRSALDQAWSAVQELYLTGANAIDDVFVSLQNTIDGVITYLRQQLNVAMSEMGKFALSTLEQVNNVASVLAKLDPTGQIAAVQAAAAKALKGSTLVKMAQDPTDRNNALATDSEQRRFGRLTDLQQRTSDRTAAGFALQQGRGVQAGNAANDAALNLGDIDGRLNAALDKARLARMLAQQGDAADIERRNRLARAAQAAAAAPQTAAFGATFSAAALVAQNGGGTNIQKDIAAATKATARGVAKLVEQDKKRQQQGMAAALIPVA